ncbi:cysteine hydrolase [Neobacillus sp. NPDC093182]|uniref:cysteine hydrolase n=1 Tax=Neobacillus sp. NPDC093182 TaxID=3364297 RepID=UPI00382CA2B6
MRIDPQTTGILLTDPQNEFLHPTGAGYSLTKDILAENDTINNIELLLKTAKEKNYQVFVSPHYYYPHDKNWKIKGGGESMMQENNMFQSKGPHKPIESASGADFYESFKPYLEDGKTIITSPHKIFGPESNDLVLQLRKRGINTVIIGGMNANLCVDSHMRELVEQGFEVYIVSDATAAPGKDAFNAGIVNFGFVSSGVWTTQEAIEKLNS